LTQELAPARSSAARVSNGSSFEEGVCIGVGSRRGGSGTGDPPEGTGAHMPRIRSEPRPCQRWMSRRVLTGWGVRGGRDQRNKWRVDRDLRRSAGLDGGLPNAKKR
jgi:hypothetical protein